MPRRTVSDKLGDERTRVVEEGEPRHVGVGPTVLRSEVEESLRRDEEHLEKTSNETERERLEKSTQRKREVLE